MPLLLIKSFEKSVFGWKLFEMHTFTVSDTQRVQNVHFFFNFSPWDYPMGALLLDVHPVGKWIAFLMSACLADSNTVKILKI